jgi:DHA1 family tetracycline resistance protein-like MFS transporter
MQQSPSKNAFLFVLVTVTLNMIGFGLIIPVIPQLLEELTGRGAEEAVVWGGILTMTYALMNFLAGPMLGALSDRYGRRPVLLASIFTLCIDFLIMAFATSLFVLFIGRALAGLSSATVSTANAYVADVTSPEERGKAFGIIGAAFGIGFILGPALGGLLGDIHTRLPFFAAAGLAVMNFLYGVFVLPESLAPEKRRVLDPGRANPFGAFRHFSKLPKVSWFLIATGTFGIAHVVYPATWSFHGEIRYDWTSGQIGASLAFVGIGAALVQAGLMGQFLKKFGEVRTALFALSMGTLALIGFSLSSAPWMAYLFIPISSLAGMAAPAVNAIMSQQTPEDAQGELQGAIASIQSLGMIFGPIIMTQTLHEFAKEDAMIDFAGAAFVLAAILTALSILPFLRGVKANRVDQLLVDTKT